MGADDAILVTGANGFVGRAVARALSERGHKLVLSVRSRDVLTDDLPACRVAATGGIDGRTDWTEALDGVGCVIHTAAIASASLTERAYDEVNVHAAAKLADDAARAGVRKFIYLSSILAVCGNAASAIINDSARPAPDSAYGRSKLKAETEVLRLALPDRLVVCLRPPLVIGHEAGGGWALLMRLAASGLPLPFAGLRVKRSLIALETLAAAVAHLAGGDHAASLSGAYAVSGAPALTLAEIMRDLRDGMGVSERLFAFPPRLLEVSAGLLLGRRRAASLTGALEVDPSRFERAFNWQSPHDLRECVRRSGRDYKAARA